MNSELRDTEWEAELGNHLRSLRLRLDLDQRQLAARAGVALNAVRNLEAGKGATVRSLVKVLRILERTDWIEALAPPVTISPLQMLKAKPSRQRVSRKRRPRERTDV
jgi:transcriptional regulator with XRE-family HTH domain